MGKILKSVVKIAAPIVGFAVGGPAGAAVGGAIGGAVGGGGIKGAITGAGLGYIGGSLMGGTSPLGGLANAAQKAGFGFTGAIGPTLTGAPLPAASGLAGVLSKASTGLSGILGTATGGSSILGGNPLLSLANLGGNLYSASAGAEAAKDAARAQTKMANQAIAAQQAALTQVRGDLEPYRAAGAATAPQLTNLVNDPTAQLNFIQNNPFYAALAEDAKNKIFTNAAAKGKVGSGGTALALQNALLLLGSDLVNQSITQRQNLAALGANAAAQTGTMTQNSASNVGELLTGIGNVNAAGIMGGYNAKVGAINNYLGTQTGIYGLNKGINLFGQRN